jgi:hypothetical protein
LKPTDRVIPGMAASHWAVAKANAEVAPRVRGLRRPSPQPRGEGSIGG